MLISALKNFDFVLYDYYIFDYHIFSYVSQYYLDVQLSMFVLSLNRTGMDIDIYPFEKFQNTIRYLYNGSQSYLY